MKTDATPATGTDDFTPITTQEDFNTAIKARLARERRHVDESNAQRRIWQEKAEQTAADAEAWRREARRWEDRARQNLAVIKAHEATIQRFVDKLDDVLNEE